MAVTKARRARHLHRLGCVTWCAMMPASTTTGTVACSMMMRIWSRVWMPRFEPMGEPSGMTVAQPTSCKRFASTGSALMMGQHGETFFHENLGSFERLDGIGQQIAGRDGFRASPIWAIRRPRRGARGGRPRHSLRRWCSAGADIFAINEFRMLANGIFLAGKIGAA